MNTNTFALSHSSPVGGQKRYGVGGGMDGSCKPIKPKKTMAKKNTVKFQERPLLYLSTRLLDIFQRAFQKGTSGRLIQNEIPGIPGKKIPKSVCKQWFTNMLTEYP